MVARSTLLIVLFVQQLGDVWLASKCGKHDLN